MEAPLPPPAAATRPQTQAERQLANLIVTTLQVEIKPEDIDPDATLFGDGLGLDSIDALELALAVTRYHGVELRSDDEKKLQILPRSAACPGTSRQTGSYPATCARPDGRS
jgi:acyl carrier protein